MKLNRFYFLIIIIALYLNTGVLQAQRIIKLTLDSAIDIALANSYEIKRHQLEMESSTYRVKAHRAGLKTQVYMNLKTPDLQRISETKWNSNLYRDEIVRRNKQLWQSDLSILQPLILFGYPTNGYLSLNYRIYKYVQTDEEERGLDYYNRLYLKFEQPFLLPNELKNNLEMAELDLNEIKMEFIAESIDIIDDVAEDYYDIFQLNYYDIVYNNQLKYLQKISEITKSATIKDSSRKIESKQIELEISNVKEKLLSNRSSFRQELADLKQDLRLNLDDSLYIIPSIKITPIKVNLDRAIQYGLDFSASLKREYIKKKLSEIDLKNEKGENSFHLSLEMTYGLENEEQQFQYLWGRHDNSNSITLNAFVPLWDGGQRNARIKANMFDVKQKELDILRVQEDIKKEIINSFTNVKEYYSRCVNMKKSMALAKEIAEESIEQYNRNDISLQDMLQIMDRYKDTEINFINIYLDYRGALTDLMVDTYYDFENDVPLIREFELDKYN